MIQEPSQTQPDGKGLLSHHEIAALTLLARGSQTIDVAAELGLDQQEVDALLHEAQIKLGATNRVNAIAIAIRLGLIGIEA